MAEMYREVPVFQQSVGGGSRSKSINISSAGGYHAMLVDSKTSEIAGGFRFDHFIKGVSMLKRFIYWRTIRESIFLTETCLDTNQVSYELKITFEASPILAVECYKSTNSSLLLIFVTTTSIHRVSFEMPSSTDTQLYTEQDSILLQINESMLTDPLHCYTFINDIGPAVPVAATIANSSDNLTSKIAIACANSLHLLGLRIEGARVKVQCSELAHNPLTFSKLIHSITDSWRGKSYTSQVVAMSFDTQTLKEHQSFLYTLHRNGALRVWLLGGRCLASEYLSKLTQGSETEFHTCILRSSGSLVALYFSFQTFSEFVIISPEISMDSVTGNISSVVLKKISTILAPNYDLIDFKLCDERLWTLWCNAEGESQALFYDLSTKDTGIVAQNQWSPIILENISDKEHSSFEVGVDLKDVYCSRIFQSGSFSDKVIRKSLTMFNRNTSNITASSTAINYNMLRLKRYALTCIESQLQQECATMRQNGPLDNDQIQEISNGLWEKFYLYCIQYRFESSRPIGLFICEGVHNEKSLYPCVKFTGIIRKKYVSFFRVCDDLEAAFYFPLCYDNFSPGSSNDSSLKENPEMTILVAFLSEIEQTLTAEQKHKLDSFIHQRRENESSEMYISFIEATQNKLLIHNLLPAFLQRISNLPRAIETLLQYLTPMHKDDYLSSWQKESSGLLAVCNNYELTSEIVLTTVKQAIQLRYLLLRNLLLLQNMITRHCNFHYYIIDAIQSTIGPDTENILRCYHVMNWIAQTRLDIDWTKCNKIAITLPLNIRTSLTLLQAYAITQMNELISLSRTTHAEHTVTSSSLIQKANIVIAFICPSSDDFLFGEWLSQNDLHVHVDEYVRLLSNWCEWNSCSRNFIKAKSCLSLGDTSKALDLFPLSLKGIQNERILKKFWCQDENNPIASNCAALTAFYLKLIRLFQKDGAYDGVLKLVHSGIDNTIDPMQQTMFQSIEFSCHIELSHYEEAYNALIKNPEPARKKDCLRQLICLLFSVRRLDILLDLPYYGLEEEFTNIVGMSARSADIADCLQYNFLYSFYAKQMNLRKAAIVAYEEGMRNYLECNSFNHLNRYYCCLMKCLNSLSVIKESYAWIVHPIIEQVEAPTAIKEDIIDIVDKKRLEEQLITTQCALQLSVYNEGFKLVTSLDAMNLISLLVKRTLYRSALKLARCRMRSMIPTIYEHITSSCIAASFAPEAAGSNFDNTIECGLPWLNDNCLSDLVVLSDSTTTAWNYLRLTLEQENEDLVNDAYLAVFNRILSRCAYIPTWLKKWCFENIPTQFIRAYLRHGRLDEAYEYTIELFKTRFFSTGRFNQHTIFPLSLCEYLLYELETSSEHNMEMQQIEHYLRIIEVVL
ncbi:nuclear pore complex protein Nup160 homolog isoform X1 [Anopheles funestus]|uniref:nuclear pore complex protein Nup160 homolog isoform X1 n=1 Tax=Anopheles funestus TaxID=62324 RepID=UPI0020C6E474|nr:nuclear pore complex protein Nup160 homolog isoform X1 [Anopheles funestus]